MAVSLSGKQASRFTGQFPEDPDDPSPLHQGILMQEAPELLPESLSRCRREVDPPGRLLHEVADPGELGKAQQPGRHDRGKELHDDSMIGFGAGLFPIRHPVVRKAGPQQDQIVPPVRGATIPDQARTRSVKDAGQLDLRVEMPVPGKGSLDPLEEGQR